MEGRGPARDSSQVEPRSSGLPRFADPDVAEAEAIGTSTGTGAQLSSSLSRSTTLVRSQGGKVALAFVGAVAIGLFIGSYAISRPPSVRQAVPPNDEAPTGLTPQAEAVADASTPWSVVSVPLAKPGAAIIGPPPTAGTHHQLRQKPSPPPPLTSAAAPTHKEKEKDCDPPYTLDDEGHRHYKLNCFGP